MAAVMTPLVRISWFRCSCLEKADALSSEFHPERIFSLQKRHENSQNTPLLGEDGKKGVSKKNAANEVDNVTYDDSIEK